MRLGAVHHEGRMHLDVIKRNRAYELVEPRGLALEPGGGGERRCNAQSTSVLEASWRVYQAVWVEFVIRLGIVCAALPIDDDSVA
jgi:hypothetical protein